jgi:putative flippase GtrA
MIFKDAKIGGGLMMKVRYLVVGLWNTFFGIGLFYLLLNTLKSLDYRLVLLVSFVVANVHSHFMQRILVWNSAQSYGSELMHFLLSAIGVFLLNLLLLTILVGYFHYPAFLSQTILTLLLTLLNYFFQKHAVFKSSLK